MVKDDLDLNLEDGFGRDWLTEGINQKDFFPDINWTLSMIYEKLVKRLWQQWEKYLALKQMLALNLQHRPKSFQRTEGVDADRLEMPVPPALP